MSLRLCAYKDCENLYIDGRPNGNYTLFIFPKDAERAKTWKELGCVNEKIPPRDLFMCSQHFDPKYVSVSNKRRVLVPTAVPIPYKNVEALNNTETTDTDTLSPDYVINIETHSDEEHMQLKVESTTANISEETEEGDTGWTLHSVKHTIVATEAPTRKTNNFPKSSQTASTQSKRQRLLEEELEESEADIPSDEQLIDKSLVSTFIFQGEEYVQMPKEVYLSEKRDLLQTLHQYEQVLKNIKTQVSQFGL
ncbi:uncharacterized protein LOC115625046 [Scaptodrosophila lebanonensis]|uniref:Uncharacterized protein LOC115625046 n=1 Tax=Drosophila lebanonensis TaxID=7225 RepID=A0A6J2TL82_DROLE|nr:uncharacterized protein LOC115625046 [Scaptodrosophila lebanonensis]